jgi:hypothetical protein
VLAHINRSEIWLQKITIRFHGAPGIAGAASIADGRRAERRSGEEIPHLQATCGPSPAGHRIWSLICWRRPIQADRRSWLTNRSDKRAINSDVPLTPNPQASAP